MWDADPAVPIIISLRVRGLSSHFQMADHQGKRNLHRGRHRRTPLKNLVGTLWRTNSTPEYCCKDVAKRWNRTKIKRCSLSAESCRMQSATKLSVYTSTSNFSKSAGLSSPFAARQKKSPASFRKKLKERDPSRLHRLSLLFSAFSFVETNRRRMLLE